MKNFRQQKTQGGFTLIELLVVIGILAILLAITLIALNPSKHFKGARNAQRQSDVSAILDAIYEYEAAHSGNVSTNAANATSTAAPVAKLAAVSASGTSFSSPNLTFTVPSGNVMTTAGTSVTVTGCSQAGDNGTFSIVSGTGTTVVVNDASGSATSATGCSLSGYTGYIDLCELTPTYLADLPTDPDTTVSSVTGGATPCAGTTTAYKTGYTLAKNSGRFTVAAPAAEDGATISVTR